MKTNIKIGLLTAGFLCVLATKAFAADGRWINNGSANWSATASWSGSVIADACRLHRRFRHH